MTMTGPLVTIRDLHVTLGDSEILHGLDAARRGDNLLLPNR